MRFIHILFNLIFSINYFLVISNDEYESLDLFRNQIYVQFAIQNVKCNAGSCTTLNEGLWLEHQLGNNGQNYEIYAPKSVWFGPRSNTEPFLKNLFVGQFKYLRVILAKTSRTDDPVDLLNLGFTSSNDFNERFRLQHIVYKRAYHVFDIRVRIQEYEKTRASLFLLFDFSKEQGKYINAIHRNVLDLFDKNNMDFKVIYNPHKDMVNDKYMYFPPDIVLKPNKELRSFFENKKLKHGDITLTTSYLLSQNDKYFYFNYEDGVSKCLLKIANYKVKNYDEYEIDKTGKCPADQCSSHGECNFLDDSTSEDFKFECNCDEGYYGYKCEYREKKCVNCEDPFFNSQEEITCKEGWTGDDCLTEDSLDDMCQNDGQSILEGTNRKCECQTYFEGDYCEKDNTPPDPTEPEEDNADQEEETGIDQLDENAQVDENAQGEENEPDPDPTDEPSQKEYEENAGEESSTPPDIQEQLNDEKEPDIDEELPSSDLQDESADDEIEKVAQKDNEKAKAGTGKQKGSDSNYIPIIVSLIVVLVIVATVIFVLYQKNPDLFTR